jgi:hypothetical protein
MQKREKITYSLGAAETWRDLKFRVVKYKLKQVRLL